MKPTKEKEKKMMIYQVQIILAIHSHSNLERKALTLLTN